MDFRPTLESLNQHQVPDWFRDAKFGIFIHWGPYSVPAFAPDPRTAQADEVGEGIGFNFKYNPYAEWYLNTMRFEDSATAEFHRKTYGADYPYEKFGGAFNESLADWRPDDWARVFKQSGARYVILVTKHHDGFLLWPSATPNPHKPNWNTRRDVVGELAEAVRAQGLKFGVYYSGGMDWTFKHDRLQGIQDLFANIPGDAEGYTSYANAHYAELISRYRPDYLWNDIGYPSDAAAFGVLADYYNRVPDGLANDRWKSPEGWADAFANLTGGETMIPPPPVWDVRTPEYRMFDRILPFDWETTRGLGRSFGYNRVETEADLMSRDEILAMLIKSASFNGNVLLNTGPRGDAQLDPPQVDRLLAVGDWLEAHGRYLQDTRPVELPVSKVAGVGVGAVETADELIIHLFATPEEQRVRIALPDQITEGSAKLIGGSPGDATLDDGDLVLIPANWPDAPTQIAVIPKQGAV